MVGGSWLVVRGSWLVVGGSWFVVRGSCFVLRASCFVVGIPRAAEIVRDASAAPPNPPRVQGGGMHASREAAHLLAKAQSAWAENGSKFQNP